MSTNVDPALLARAQAAHELLQEDPGVKPHDLLAAVVWPKDPILERAEWQSDRRGAPVSLDTVERLFDLREQGKTFTAIARELRRPASTLKAIARLGREEARRRYAHFEQTGQRNRVA